MMKSETAELTPGPVLQPGEFEIEYNEAGDGLTARGTDWNIIVENQSKLSHLHRVAIPVLVGKEDSGERRRLLRIAFHGHYLYVDEVKGVIIVTDNPDISP